MNDPFEQLQGVSIVKLVASEREELITEKIWLQAEVDNSFIYYDIVCYKIAKMWMQVQENAKELKECSKDHLQIVKKAEE